MSQNHSCVPPPSDYTPRKRPPQQGSKFHDRGGRNNRSQKRRHPQSMTFQRDQFDAEERLKNQPKDKFHKNEDDEYFAHVQDDEEEIDENKDDVEDNEDEDDPLDAYMKSLESDSATKTTKSKASSIEESSQDDEESTQPRAQSTSQVIQESEKRAIRLDIDETDDIEESYYQYVEQTKKKQSTDQDIDYDLEEKQDLVEYDKDGNVISVRKVKREIDPLPAIDHSTINYELFEKVFYQEHDEIQKLTPEQADELRSKLEIKVSGESPPRPVCSFAHFKFDEKLMKVIRRSEYTQPTPIQAQAIPAALLGRNIIGIARTGSGKTAAYIWPMIVHIMGQPDLKRGDGPIGLVLVPTRELALQVYGEAKKFSSSYNIAVVCAYGGGSKYEQSKDLEAGAEIVVATPGRIIDLIKGGATNLRRITYLVLDEADRFFEMGFEAQVRSICDQVRPDRQTLLFSATFKHKIEQLARTVTENPVKIVQKTLGEVNEDVTQHVIVLSGVTSKWDWLVKKLVEFTSTGSVLIFVTRIVNSEELHKNLKDHGQDALLLHGDMEQSERNRVITCFKRKEKDILIATDVAARGLDIAHIRTVINFDVARDIDTHVHRVGRTGRAGSKGDAYTLMNEKDKDFAGHLVKNLEASSQKVSEELMKLAMQSHTFRKSRISQNKHHHRTSSNDSQHRRRDQHQHEQRQQQHHHHHHHHAVQNSHWRDSHRHHDSHRSQHNYHRGGHSSSASGGSQSSRDFARSSRGEHSSSRDSSHSDHRKRPRWN